MRFGGLEHAEFSMNESDIPLFDANKPEAVVGTFIRAMNMWETYANRVSRERKADAWPEIHRSQKTVFDAFCTQKERKQGRNGSFQRPPEYDPDSERIVGIEPITGSKTHVVTERESILGGGRYQYVLLRQANRWFIDSVKYLDGSKWRNSIL